GHSVRRSFDDPHGGGHGNSTLPATWFGLNDLPWQRVIHQPNLAIVISGDRGASVGRRRRA
ncbi:MAG TPA: hypothetical protein VK606_01085, partial [Verrucomicrobiae bacterium]|nr:hypothetical protein [Verrucomicrobiae bacterium]